MRRGLALVAVLAVLATACGDDGGDSAAPPDPELCALLAEDEPGPEVVEQLPGEYRLAAAALLAMNEIDLAMDSADGLLGSFLESGVGDQFSALADEAAACGSTEAAQSLRSYAVITELGSVAADDEYCAMLLADLDPADGDDDGVPPALIAAAPSEHADALRQIDELATADGVPAGDVLGLLGGLGLYAEAQCGGESMFGAMLFAGLFASAFAGDDGVISSSGIDPTTEPVPGDPSAANAALPAGAGFAFVTQTVAVEDDGEYLVSAVVPEGWDVDADGFFGATFEPAGGDFDFFTDLSLRAGCDGFCEPTDWQERLESSDGYLARTRENAELRTDEALAGDGWLLVADGFSGGVDATVLRWNDGADRYLICEASLGEDDVDYLDAFVAACAAASPGWFPA